MVTVSLSAHVVVIITAALLPTLRPRATAPQWDTILPGVLVDLPPSMARRSPPVAASPAAPSTAPPPPKKSVPPPPRKKKSPEKVSKKKPPTRPKPQAKPEPAKRSPEPDRPGEPVPGAVAGEPATPSPAGGETGLGLTLGSADFDYAYYTSQLLNILRANWQRPVYIGSGDRNLSVRVLFHIHEDGSVSDIRIDAPSPDRRLDESALRAVSAVSRFPPLPPQFTEDTLNVAITFTLDPGDV